jgi:DNA-binding CsgD family transcriptional regulator/tetratricopeptide (TPR) repeat protein
MMDDVGLRATSPVVIGRDGEMARLSRALDVIDSDGPAVVLVTGEAGVGKTRLVEGLVTEARRRRVRVGVANCIDLGETIYPLAPVRDLIAGVIDGLDDEAVDLVLGPARGALARLMPELGAVPSDAPAISSEQLCELVIGVLDRVSRRGPLLLLVEDLHWADATTRMMLAALGRGGPSRPLLLVGTFRDDELHRRHPLRPLLAELERRPNCERIAVRPLDRWETALLIEALDPALADRTLVEQVHHRGGGNPFFVEELVAARRAGVNTIPDALRDVVLAHTATLDDGDIAVLGALAAAGEASADLLADVTGLDADQIHAALLRLRATALLAGGETARFRHELAREVCYDELVPGERTRLHARLATGLERRSPHRLGEIAHHWSAARNAHRALPTAVAAGRQALTTGAAAEAEGHLARALDLWDGVADAATLSGVDHAGLLVETAAAAKLAGRLDRGIELYLRAATELAGREPLREADVWLELRDLYRFANRYADCVDALARALALTPTDRPTATRARALATSAAAEYYHRRPAAELALASEAVAIAKAVGDPAVIVRAHNALAFAHSTNQQSDQALAVARANVERSQPTVPPELVLAAHNTLVSCYQDASRWADVAVAAEAAIRFARGVGLGAPLGSSIAFSWLDALALLGRWSEAEALLPEIIDLFESPSIKGYLGQAWGIPLVRQGRIDEARPLIDETRTILADSDWPSDRAWNVGAVALFDAADGRPDHALQLVDEQFARSDADATDGEASLLSIGIEILADVELARTRRDAEAGTRAERTANRWTDHVLAPGREDLTQWAADAVDRQQALAHLSRLRRQSEPERWVGVTDGWHELGFRYDEAAARFRFAEAMLSRTSRPSASDRVAATEQLEQARLIAVELPAPPLLARIDDLARRARLAVHSPANRGTTTRGEGSALTMREREVLDLLARGRTNGQIATELFISTKTASVHVSNILRKLGVANRVEAAQLARTAPTGAEPVATHVGRSPN